ncbi:hypothetical protein ACFE04_030148 [Oxalis oulophora]
MLACCFGVDHLGRGGGLALLWRNAIDVSLNFVGENFIDCIVHSRVKGDWRLTDYTNNLTSDEKVGGAIRTSAFYEGFCATVEDCGLENIPHLSNFFMWKRLENSRLRICE